jgi:protocatechuate 3,4-dioxygenase beta subunit
MTFQLGVYSFGNTPLLDGERLGPTSQAIRDVLESIGLAEQVGLDFFGVGEYHRHIMPISSSASVINAAAVTTRIGLGSAVTVLFTDDPVRVCQQHAMAAALAPGRVEITVDRGSGTGSYPVYGCRPEDRDSLFAAKLDLLLAVNAAERVTWDGPHRAQPLRDALVVPRADPPMTIWLGSGGSPESSIRAGHLGLPVAYGILNGTAEHWARVATTYREAGHRAGHDAARLEVSVAAHGLVSDDGRAAKENFYRYENSVLKTVGTPSNCWAPRSHRKYGQSWDERRLTRDATVGSCRIRIPAGRPGHSPGVVDTHRERTDCLGTFSCVHDAEPVISSPDPTRYFLKRRKMSNGPRKGSTPRRLRNGDTGPLPYFAPVYAPTLGRAPMHSLVRLPILATETTGPVSGCGPIGDSDHDLIQQHAGIPIGERIVVSGRLLDNSGHPITQTLVEIWQANSAGRYTDLTDHYDAPLDPNFTGTGRCLTDAEGWYRFTTIMPGSRPWEDRCDAWRPPHIHFSVTGGAFNQRLITQMYFPGDPLLREDPVVQAVPEPQRSRLISRLDHAIGVNGWARGYRFDIVLPNAQCTRSAGQPDNGSGPTVYRTPPQTIGAFFAPALLRPELQSSTHDSDVTAIELTGAVYDGAGRPVPHAMIETWQPDPENAGNGHFIRTGTGSSGHYRLRTARPGRIPGSSSAPNIELSLFAAGLNDRVVTRAYLADDPSGNATDPLLAGLLAGRRYTLLAHPEPSGPIARYRFDISLQGNGETVFFLI